MRLPMILAIAVSSCAVACQADTFVPGDAGGSDSAAGVDAAADGPSAEAGIDGGSACSSWCPVSSPQGAPDLLAVWGNGTKNVWVGGKGGFLANWNGSDWSNAVLPTTADVIDLAGNDAAAYLLTSAGDVFKLATSTWSDQGTFNGAVAIALDPGGFLWVATPDTVYEDALGSPISFTMPITVHDLAVNATDFFAVGSGGSTNLHVGAYSGTPNNLERQIGQAGAELDAVAATNGVAVVAGPSGLVGTSTLPFQSWNPSSVGSQDWMGAAVGVASFAFVGNNGALAAGNGSGIAQQSSPTSNALRAVAAVPKTIGVEFWAVGDKGTVLRSTF